MSYSYKSITAELKKVCQGVFKDIYTAERPKTTPAPMNEFVVCTMPARRINLNAYTETLCRFSIFVKDIKGVENYTRLSELEELLINKIPVKNDVCLIWNPIPIQGGADDSGFHTLHIQCNLVIF